MTVNPQSACHNPASADARELPLVAIVGPTGSGKSDLALRIAETFAGEIINCDSLQVYRHFNIGTAKLPKAEWRGIPHHLIDIVAPDEVFTAGDFARAARVAIADISARGKLPVVVGGTGLYLRALLDGLFEGPARDEALRTRLAAREARRTGSLHRLLGRFDRETAARIHANDVPKVMRAVEVCMLSGRPVSELFREGRDALQGYRVLKTALTPDRDLLYERLDARCAAMFAGGLVEEVQGILDLGYAPTCKPFESHGYKQALQMINRELSPRDALFYAQRNTRNYAKRQITWFRKETDVRWLKGFSDAAETQDAALRLVRDFL